MTYAVWVSPFFYQKVTCLQKIFVNDSVKLVRLYYYGHDYGPWWLTN